jgi:predicted transcriptional regulator
VHSQSLTRQFGAPNLCHGDTLSPEQSSRLAELAHERRREPHLLAEEAITRYLEEENRFAEAVKLGETQLEKGEDLTHEEVGNRIRRMFKS